VLCGLFALSCLFVLALHCDSKTLKNNPRKGYQPRKVPYLQSSGFGIIQLHVQRQFSRQG